MIRNIAFSLSFLALSNVIEASQQVKRSQSHSQFSAFEDDFVHVEMDSSSSTPPMSQQTAPPHNNQNLNASAHEQRDISITIDSSSPPPIASTTPHKASPQHSPKTPQQSHKTQSTTNAQAPQNSSPENAPHNITQTLIPEPSPTHDGQSLSITFDPPSSSSITPSNIKKHSPSASPKASQQSHTLQPPTTIPTTHNTSPKNALVLQNQIPIICFQTTPPATPTPIIESLQSQTQQQQQTLTNSTSVIPTISLATVIQRSATTTTNNNNNQNNKKIEAEDTKKDQEPSCFAQCLKKCGCAGCFGPILKKQSPSNSSCIIL